MDNSVILSNGIIAEGQEYKVQTKLTMNECEIKKGQTLKITRIRQDSITIKTDKNKEIKLHFGEMDIMLERNMIKNITPNNLDQIR